MVGFFFVFFVFPLLDAAGIKWRDGGALRQLFPFWFTAALPSTRQKLACPPLGQRKPADPADFRQVFFCPPPPTFPNFAPSLRAQQCGLNKTQCSTVPLSTTRPPPPRAYLPLHPLSQTHKHPHARVHSEKPHARNRRMRKRSVGVFTILVLQANFMVRVSLPILGQHQSSEFNPPQREEQNPPSGPVKKSQVAAVIGTILSLPPTRLQTRSPLLRLSASSPVFY